MCVCFSGGGGGGGGVVLNVMACVHIYIFSAI